MSKTIKTRKSGLHSSSFLISWHVLAVAFITVAPARVWLGELTWQLPMADQFHLWGLVGAYVAAAAVLTVIRVWGVRVSLVGSIAMAALALASLYVGLLLVPDIKYSRGVLVLGSGMVFVCLVAPHYLPARPAYVGVLAAATVLVGLADVGLSEPTREGGETGREIIPSSHHLISATYNDEAVGSSTVWGGGLVRAGDETVLVTGDGRLFILGVEESSDGSSSLRAARLPIDVPLNAESFASDVRPEVNENWFRANDVFARRSGSDIQLFVSHHFWRSDRRCFVLRISTVSFDRTAIVEQAYETPEWETLYESQPCLPIKKESRGHPFAGNHSAGSMVAYGDSSLLLSVGDYAFDGWNSERVVSQDLSSDYGKTLIVRPDGEAEMFSLGHRNPQGLYRDDNGTLWSVEHGPDGGDELNILEASRNYGWPYETTGTEYGGYLEWPVGERSNGYEPPVHSWVPSPAISDIASARSTQFERWGDDLLVASLKAETLFRIGVQEEEVRFIEDIDLGHRIRALVQDGEGGIILWTDRATLVRLKPVGSDGTSGGERTSLARCWGCHQEGADGGQGLGPSLAGVVGREIGGKDDYRYSEAFRNVSGRWTESRLDAFLADPTEFAPGTKMRMEGISDPELRAEIIDRLRSR